MYWTDFHGIVYQFFEIFRKKGKTESEDVKSLPDVWQIKTSQRNFSAL